MAQHIVIFNFLNQLEAENEFDIQKAQILNALQLSNSLDGFSDVERRAIISGKDCKFIMLIGNYESTI